MLRREQIEQFYHDVERIGLKFPVAAIAAQTGHSKANVSKYLRRKLEPSEAFLKAFYEKFPKGDNNVSRETNGKESANDLTAKYINLLEKQQELNSVEIEEKLAAILAYQKTFYHILAKLTAKVEKSSPGSVLSDMDKLLAGAFRDIRKTNISGVDNGTKA